MSGHVGDLSHLQAKVLNEFKDTVADVHRPDYDDYYYLRWLRARDFDIPKAELMMRKNLQWRKRFGVDYVLEDYTPPELMAKYYPASVLGVDKEGCPVWILSFKNLDYRGLSHALTKFEIMKYLAYIFEQDIELMKQQSEKLNRVIEKHIFILDLEGYGIKRALNKEAVTMLNETVKMYEANYPERMKAVVFVNVPAYFNIILALTKPFLSDVTINKFSVFGKDGYQEHLRSIIDPDVIPAYLGGNRTDPDGDPTCKTIVNYGGFVPRSFYFITENRNFVTEDGVRCMLLKSRSSKSVDIPIPAAGYEIQWEVTTCNKDVGIGLFYKKMDPVNKTDRLDIVLPTDRINCHLVPESCTFMCEEAGTYVLRFDNSYSWFTSKKLFYRIKMIKPSEITSLD